MMSIEILLIALVTALATSLIGIFLVLRKLSMLTDAISHTILLGIVIAYYFVGDLHSPILLVGATLMGVLTVYLIESILKVKHVNEGAAIGVVFTMLFSIAVIVINTQYRNVHLDVHMVLLGNLEFTIFNRTHIGPFNLPTSLVVMTTVLMLNVVLIGLFYKEIKLISFDYALAKALGFAPVLLHYVMMTFVSLTAVAAFDAVGAILVIALMIGPPITALFYTKTLFKTILLTLLIAMINTVVGYQLSIMLDVTISGMIATVVMFNFMISFIFAPKKGLLSRLITIRQQKKSAAFITLMQHIKNHENTPEAYDELGLATINEHLRWKKALLDKVMHKAIKEGYVKIRHDVLQLSEKGLKYYQNLKFIHGS